MRIRAHIHFLMMKMMNMSRIMKMINNKMRIVIGMDNCYLQIINISLTKEIVNLRNQFKRKSMQVVMTMMSLPHFLNNWMIILFTIDCQRISLYKRKKMPKTWIKFYLASSKWEKTLWDMLMKVIFKRN